MDTFTLNIDTGNAAFEGSGLGNEVSRILRELAAHLEDMDATELPLEARLRDINGNTVGSWRIT